MPTYNESLTEAGSAAQAFGSQSWTTQLSNAVVATSSVVGSRFFVVSSTANATSSVELHDTHQLTSTAAAVSSLLATATRARSLISEALAQSSLTFSVTSALSSSANAVSSLTQRQIAQITENVLAVGTITLIGRPQMIIVDSAAAVSALSFGKAIVLSSGADAISAVTLKRIAELASAGSATSAVTPVNNVLFELSSAANATSATTVRADRFLSLVSSAIATSHVRLPSAAHEAFWANTRTLGAAQWNHLKVNSIVEKDGVLYGAAADGVHELDTSGTHVGEVMWDLMDFGSAQMKTVGATYVDGTSLGPFTVRVATKQGVWDYQTHLPNGSDETQNHRAAPGRGLKATHYRFSVLENAHFDVGAVRVQIAEAARRRG